jgi:hypothetical protein
MITQSFYRTLKAVKPLRAAVRHLRKVWRTLRPDAWVLEGVERTSGEFTRVLYVGQIENCVFVAQVVFAAGSVERRRRRMWSWQVSALLHKPKMVYDMIFVQRQPGVDARRLGQPCFVLPSWVAGELSVTQALASHRGNKSVKTDLRNIHRYGFTYRTTCDSRELDRFLSDMYLPYVRQTRGDGAFVATREELERTAGIELRLLLIEREGKDVAGVCLGVHDQDRLDALELGVVGADRDLVRKGALAAIYYFSLVYAAERKFSRLYLGGSRPFLRDGPFQYKKKWGLKIVGRLPTLPDVIIFRPRLSAVGVRCFLTNNPFVYEEGGEFRAAVFVDKQQSPFAESTDTVRKANCLPGLAGATVFRIDANARLAPEGHEAPLSAPRVAAQ